MKPLVLLFGTIALAAPLRAQVLFIVDESDPTAISITATGNFPSTAASYNFYDGIDLLNFFSADASNLFEPPTTATLTTGNSSTGPLFNEVNADFYTSGSDVDDTDLNLYKDLPMGDTSPPETFTTTAPAFHGALAFDSTGYPLAGTNGIVLAGSSSSGGTEIGTYEVIGAPEPSTYAMIFFGILALLGMSRFRALAIAR